MWVTQLTARCGWHNSPLEVRGKEDREVRLGRFSLVVSRHLLAASMVATVTSPVLSPRQVWNRGHCSQATLWPQAMLNSHRLTSAPTPSDPLYLINLNILTLSLSHTHTHNFTQIYTHTQACTHTHTHTQTHTFHTHTHTHSQTHTHTHTHNLSPSTTHTCMPLLKNNTHTTTT